MKGYGKVTAVAVLVVIAIVGAAWGIRHGAPDSENSDTAEPETVEEIMAETNNEETRIQFEEDNISVSGTGVSVSGSTVYITKSGTYAVNGTLENGQIYISAGSQDTVILSLEGVELSNTSDAALYLENAEQTLIILEEGTTNRIQSGNETELDEMDDASDQAEGAAIYARDNLLITGNGTLQVYGYINNGIHTTNHLVIDSGIYEVTAKNNGIKGKDSVSISGGEFTISSGGDGIKSDDSTGEGYGVISITGGTFDIQSESDGIQAQTLLEITSGEFSVAAGGGNSAGQGILSTEDAPDANWDREDTGAVSMKGLKSDGTIRIKGGTFSIDTEDDGIHANDTVEITGGEVEISTGDDGIHGNNSLTVEDGEIRIFRSYEGLEANQIRLYGGTISIVSSDDGINAYGGQNNWGWGDGGSSDAPEEMPNLYLSGGTITVNADGDGIDSNGNIIVEDGVILVDGPASNWNGAIDSGSENGGSCVINGGTFLALGSSGMAESFEEDSEQCSFQYNFSSTQQAGNEIIITDTNGNTLISHRAEKEFSSVIFSSPELSEGDVINLEVDGQTVEIQLESISNSAGERSRWRW